MRTFLRTRTPGGLYFFTLVVGDRHGGRLLVDRIDALRDAVRRTRFERPFGIEAMVVLPDHLHALWQMPEGDADFATRWRLIKSRFSRSVDKTEPLSRSRLRKRERGVWQRRYWEHFVRDEEDFRRHLDYIHFNPVKHGYVSSASDWPYSSFQRWVGRGVYPLDWGRAGAATLGAPTVAPGEPDWLG